jgi:phosphoserine aminotransferase
MNPPLFTFGPGPSQISPLTQQDIHEAVDSGLLQMSHRSKQFQEMSSKALAGLRMLFTIPDDYMIFYTSSATEAMELTIRNLVGRTSFHFVNGSFSSLFQTISQKWGNDAFAVEAPWGSSHDYRSSVVSADRELITMTYNETSTGAMCTNEDVMAVRKNNPDALLAIDITSMAGMKHHPIDQADVWVFSVQKGFGLPSGLGVMIVSPRAMEKALRLEKEKPNAAGIFSFSAMQDYMQRGGQTINTPNILNIFLLGRQLERWNSDGGLACLEKETEEKSAMVYAALENHPTLSCFVQESQWRSSSVICVQGPPDAITELHAAAKEQGMILGKGYGKLKDTTVRLAMFPAVTREYVERLVGLMRR